MITIPKDIPSLLSLALWLAGAGHFCVLIASFQVPVCSRRATLRVSCSPLDSSVPDQVPTSRVGAFLAFAPGTIATKLVTLRTAARTIA